MFWKSNNLLTGVFVHTRGEITFSSLDLHQIFVHPRTAFEESDKVVERSFDSCPRHRAVRAPRRPKRCGGSLRLFVLSHFGIN